MEGIKGLHFKLSTEIDTYSIFTREKLILTSGCKVLPYLRCMFNIYLIILIVAISTLGVSCTSAQSNSDYPRKNLKIGDTLDLFNRVVIYYNGDNYTHSQGKNYSEDGYYYGQKGQCVEFVKRFYYEAIKHRMPNVWGHAISFYQKGLKDGGLNKDRNLLQYNDGSSMLPTFNDILVFPISKFGHVAIVTNVKDNKVYILQQNMGYDSRDEAELINENGKISVVYKGKKAKCWLRKP